MEYIKKYVKEMVKELGYKQTAIEIGVSITSVKNWINKETEMNLKSRESTEQAYKLFKGADY